MRVAFAGGGTGGHIVPGLHLVETLESGLDSALDPGPQLEDLLWFTSGRAVEERVLENLHTAAAWERVVLQLEPPAGGAPSLVRLLTRTPGAVRCARRALRRHGSEVLLGLGGFTSLPAILAARSLGIPVALLEINAAPGRATRYLGCLATRVFHAWSATMPGAAPSARDLRLGAPVSPAVVRVGQSSEERASARVQLGLDPRLPLLLVLGGSQGAGSLNAFIGEHGGALLGGGLQILHQCGPGRRAQAPPDREGLRVREYLSPMAPALQAATLVLCRGGASTLAELVAARRAAVVVPYPHHPDQHQRLNAQELGAGVRIVRDEDLNGELAADLVELCAPGAASRRQAMQQALAELGGESAAQRIWNELQTLVRVGG